MTNDASPKQRSKPITVVGTVVSDKMSKTITVREDRLVKHPRYGKYIRRSTRYKAHDERSEASEGDKVEIVATRPLSKTKTWRLLRIIRRVGEVEDAPSTPAGEEVTS